MFQQQQNIPQDSTAKQTVQNVAPVDSLKKKAVAKTDSLKHKPKAVKVIQYTAAVDSTPRQDTVITEAPVVSLFTGHELKPTNQTPIENPDFYPGWITAILLGCAIVIAYLRSAYPKKFTEFFRAVLDMRFAAQMVREEKVFSQRLSLFLTLIFLVTSSSFAWFIISYFNLHLFAGNGILPFIKILFSIILLFLFRVFIVELSGVIFKARQEFSFYTFHVFLFNKALGLALIPVLAGIVYAHSLPQSIFIYSGMFMFLVAYITRLIRGLNIGLAKQGFNKFYLFFYFCTLEIIPVAILAKFILKHSS